MRCSGARSLSTRDAGDSGTLRDMANNVKTVGLLGLLGGIFVAVGRLFGGQQGALLAPGIAVVINFEVYWFSDKRAIAAAKARPV